MTIKTVLALSLGALVLSGCAVAAREDGSFVLGVPMSGDGATASGIGTAVGGIAGILGIPGGALWGGVATTVAGALGIGYHAKAARAAKLEGHNEGWDERESAATVQVPMRSAVQ